MNPILNFVFKRQKVIVFAMIFLIFTAIGFRFGSEQSGWFWSDYPFVAMILVSAGLFLTYLWAQIEQKKVQDIIRNIEESEKNDPKHFEDRLSLLTRRQQEILELIAAGKSNKEIMDLLFIELSTLKTHINNIYKTLQISNRKEARALNRLTGIEKN